MWYYTSGVNVYNTWFLISAATILRQHKLNFSSRGISDAYIIINKKKSNFLVVQPNSNDSTWVISTSELISETTETKIQQSALQELEKQKAKLDYSS